MVYLGSLISGVLSSSGTYGLEIVGSTTLAGGYSGILAISPVPEPEQWAMMMVGLTLIGVQTLRAKKAAAPLGLAA